MKILHALVGYLAATALPFYKFALASPPLAATTIDYDSYVDSKQNSDGALMKRMPGDNIEVRQEEAAPAVLIVLAIVAAVALSIIWIDADDPVRGQMMSESSL